MKLQSLIMIHKDIVLNLTFKACSCNNVAEPFFCISSYLKKFKLVNILQFLKDNGHKNLSGIYYKIKDHQVKSFDGEMTFKGFKGCIYYVTADIFYGKLSRKIMILNFMQPLSKDYIIILFQIFLEILLVMI